mgnify:FL=1
MVYSAGYGGLERHLFTTSGSAIGSHEDQRTIYPSGSQGLSNRERDYSDH